MTKTNGFLAGTALCLLLTAPLAAQASNAGFGSADGAAKEPAPLLLAQAEAPEGAEEGESPDCPPGTEASEEDGGCVLLEDAPVEDAPPAAERPVDEDAAEEPAEAEEAVPPEPPAEPQAAPAEEAAPEEAVPEEPAPAEPTPEAQQPEEQPAEEAAPAEAEEPAPEAEEAPAEEAPAAVECPSGTEPTATGECVAPEEESPAEEAAPAEETPPAVTPETEAPADEAAPVEEAPVEEAPAEAAPAEAEQVPAEEAPAEEVPAEEAPAPQVEPTAPAEEEAAPEEQPVLPEGEPATETEARPVIELAPEEETVLPENAAPVLDSQKDAETAGEPAAQQPSEPEQAAEPVILPDSDAQAQQGTVDIQQIRQELRTLVEEQGQRIELGQTPQDQLIRRREIFQPRENATIIQEFNDNRTIIEINNQVFVESSDYDRLVRRGDLVYYEELRGGRVREVVERENGVRIVTIRDRYGDILSRVRVMPDGREYVLAYTPEEYYERVVRFEDPGRDLPPLRLTIPVSQYILEADRVRDPRHYYTFLEQPPVEPVRRLYSLEEVRYSARIRDMVPRIDLNTVEFEFGSARIEESEIADLEALADAMLELLERNPAETFLIEGHTDAVGSDLANLALSDRRAEAVARALTDVFGIPPENLATQGYGKRYLKVNTQRPERANRRVAVRRITPLVAPVAAR
jgi:outer membrane protein OmpA-like peptidoglycan-associated protein